MDPKGNIHVIPFSMDKLKRGRASDYPLFLEPPCSPSRLGEAVRESLILSKGDKNLTSEELMGSLGYHDWKEYSKGKRSVSVTSQGQGVALNSTIRRNDGAYIFRVLGYERVLPQKLSSKALGEAVMEMLNKSR